MSDSAIDGTDHVGAPGVSDEAVDAVRDALAFQDIVVGREDAARLAPAVEGQRLASRFIRALPLPRDTRPSVTFDPRLPGRIYPRQRDAVILAGDGSGPLPESDCDIAYASVTQLSDWLAAGAITSERLTDIYLERIARLDGRLLAYITVVADAARAEARERDGERASGRSRGPLHGVPYAIKDVFDTAGIRTSWGSDLFRDRVPESNAAVVGKLREAGAVLLGKLATGELANGSTWFGGMTRNPWNLDEPSGGSSAGSGAAVAAGLCAFSLGTDSAGSILNPADRCGVVGLRASFGRVPVEGSMPLTPSLDRIGPVTRSAEDAALVLAAIQGPSDALRVEQPIGFHYDGRADLTDVRIGYSPGWFETVGYGGADLIPASDAHKAGLEAARALGFDLVEVALPPLPYLALLPLLMAEAAAVFTDLTISGDDARLVAPWRDHWLQSRLLSAVDYLHLERFRRSVAEALDGVFRQVDMLITPTYGSFDLLIATNFTGHPGITFRSGFWESATRSLSTAPTDASGPLQRVTANTALHGRLFEEGKLIAIASAIERELNVWRERPLE